MKRIRLIVTIIVWLGLVSSCAQPLDDSAQKEARVGLDAAIAQIPQMADFTTIKVVYREFYDNEHGEGPVCYYARAFLIIGSSLPETESPNAYAERLQAQGSGWKARDNPYEPTVLYRGARERAVVSLVESVDINGTMDYTQLKKDYRSIFFVQLDFMMPSRDEC